jgi:uncharacterized protein
MGDPVVHFEINGPDGPALAAFYGELFGWKTREIPGPGYVIVDTTAGSGINGGIGTVQDDVPGGVMFYVECEDLQATLDRAASLGGSTEVPVTDMEMVTFAMVGDPQGNRVGIVLAGEGPGVSEGDGCAVGWWEILGPNPGALRDFYVELFGWKVSKSITEGFEYHMIDTDSGGRGSSGAVGATPDGQPHTSVYARVPDLQGYCERAESLGATIVMQPTPVAESTSIAVFLDPQGNPFGMYEGM